MLEAVARSLPFLGNPMGTRMTAVSSGSAFRGKPPKATPKQNIVLKGPWDLVATCKGGRSLTSAIMAKKMVSGRALTIPPNDTLTIP